MKSPTTKSLNKLFFGRLVSATCCIVTLPFLSDWYIKTDGLKGKRNALCSDLFSKHAVFAVVGIASTTQIEILQ